MNMQIKYVYTKRKFFADGKADRPKPIDAGA